MSTLKVNKLRDTAGSADAITLDPNGGAVLAGVTTVTSVKVGAAVTISESGIEASGIGITCANINGTQIGGRRNLIINGAMQVAQRGTSSTSSSYQTVDRFITGIAISDENPTQSQHTLTSSDTGPYEEGFRYSYHITNGDQSSPNLATNTIYIRQRIEAQNMSQSGWNYTSSSSFITLQFWVKSSVAQNFYGYLRTADGTSQRYAFETGSLSADTWTKITKTIPGNSNLQFNDNADNGLDVVIIPFWGTDSTDSSVSLNAWGAFSSSTRTPDSTSTWYTTNDATFEITGVQLEVGSQATPFEHRSFGEELALCQRYYFRITPSTHGFYGVGNIDGGSQGQIIVNFPTEMRVKPTSLETTGTASDYQLRVTTSVNCTGVPTIDSTTTVNGMVIPAASSHGLTDKSGAFFRAANNTSYLGFAGCEL